MQVVGLDIGGANLKGATADGVAHTQAFEIWRAPEELPARLVELLISFPPADRLAVTMTAELADCFETKAIGVESILSAVTKAAPKIPAGVWTTAGKFISVEEGRARPLDVAAANWHGLATWAGRHACTGKGLLLDIGSTTADLIPLVAGVPTPVGKTDVDRLLAGELVYSAVRRTPVFAVAPQVPFRDGFCPLAAEWFATMLDVYLVLGWIAENSSDSGTANGRPATIPCAIDRLARSICCDRSEATTDDIRVIAEFLADRQHNQIAAALEKVVAPGHSVATVVVSGEGEFLARRIVACHPATRSSRVVSLSSELSAEVGGAACAYAIAVLAAETVSGDVFGIAPGSRGVS